MRRPSSGSTAGRSSALLTEELQRVAGCQGAAIVVGASRDVAHGESNWFEFLCLVPAHADRLYVRAVAGGVVSEARERFNVLDS
jgi:hypothetical protein